LLRFRRFITEKVPSDDYFILLARWSSPCFGWLVGFSYLPEGVPRVVIVPVKGLGGRRGGVAGAGAGEERDGRRGAGAGADGVEPPEFIVMGYVGELKLGERADAAEVLALITTKVRG